MDKQLDVQKPAKNAMRSLGQFMNYIRRNPYQAPKEAFIIPPLPEKMDFTPEEFLVYQLRVNLKSILALDHSRYITDLYADKRRALSSKIDDLQRNMWTEAVPAHLRFEFANVVNFTAVYAELWQWIGNTVNSEYQLGLKSFLPCDLIDTFTEFFHTIERCHNYTHVEITDFAELLELRDAVVKCLQDLYRVAQPFFKSEDKNAKFPNHTADQRYTPYDNAWLCGNVVSGPFYMPCVKYMCVSRVAQYDLSNMRADIVAENGAIDLCYEKDDRENFRVPFPADASQPTELAKELVRTEQRMRGRFHQTKEQLLAKLERTTDVDHLITTTEMLNLQADIRVKKRNILGCIARCAGSDFRSYLQVIAVMASIETLLLILLKAAAPFVDKRWGIYGMALPQSVHRLASQLFMFSNLQSCRTLPLRQDITNELEGLRKEVRNYVKKWNVDYEQICEGVFNEKVDVSSVEQKYRTCYELSKNDFPEEMGDQAECMMRDLRLEQIEMERLLTQLCQAKRARFHWPQSDGPEFTHNACPADEITAYCSNFDERMSAADVESVARHADFVINESTLTTSIGEEVLKIAQRLMQEMQFVPTLSDMVKALKRRFDQIFAENPDENANAEELAKQLSNIIANNIELLNTRTLIHTHGTDSAAFLERMATEVCAKYMELKDNEPQKAVFEEQVVASGDSDSMSGSSTLVLSEDRTADNENPPAVHQEGDDASSESDEESDSSEGSEDSDDSDESDESSESSDSEETMLTDAVFNVLSDAASAAFLEAAAGAILFESPFQVAEEHNFVLDPSEPVPDVFVEEFIARFIGINRDELPDLNTSPYNLPID